MHFQHHSKIGDIAQGYQLEEILDHRASGTIYKARNVEKEQTISLIVLDPLLSQDRMFMRQLYEGVEVLKRLNHKNIQRYFDLQAGKGGAFLVMEHLVGARPINDLLDAGQTLPWRRAILIMRQLFSALVAVDDKELVHGNLGPESIYLLPNDRIKIGGFESIFLSQEDSIAGERHAANPFLAPEKLNTPARQDHRSDLYSAGLIAYHLLAGKQEERNDNHLPYERTFYSLPQDLKRLNSQVPDAIADLIMRLVDSSPTMRPQSAREVLDVLDDFNRTESQPHVVYHDTHSFRFSLSTLPWGKYARIALALIVLGLLLYFLRPDNTNPFEKLGTSTPAQPPTIEQRAPPNEPLIDELEVVDLREAGSPLTEPTPVTQRGTPPATETSPTQPNVTTALPVETLAAPESPVNTTDAVEHTTSLMLRSVPPQAMVTINGLQYGRTPLTIDDLEGDVAEVRLSLDGYRTQNRAVMLSPGDMLEREITLEPILTDLFLNVLPQGDFYIDGALFQEAISGSKVFPLQVKETVLRVSHPELGTWERSILPEEGKRVELNLDFNQKYTVNVTCFDTNNQAVTAEILVNGDRTGFFTPRSISLRTGTHILSVAAEGYTLAQAETVVVVDASTEQNPPTYRMVVENTF